MIIFLPARLFLLIVLFYAGTASSQGNLIQNGDYMDYMDINARRGDLNNGCSVCHGFSWRWQLSFPEPQVVRWQWGRPPRPMPCRGGCRRECPRGTVLSDCTRSEPVQCRCEPKELASLLPLLLKNYGRNALFRGITPNGIRRKLMFRWVGGCPAGTRPHGCTKSLPPICHCTPRG